MEIVAIVALGKNLEQEAPHLAADLGIMPYEAALMLRGATPIIVLRSDDRSRTSDILGKLRARGHDAVACDVAGVVSSEAMFRPKSFRLEAGEIVANGQGEERRLAFSDIFALVRATHHSRIEDSIITPERRGRGPKVIERTETSDVREAVLYVYRSDTAPWFLTARGLRYTGLGPEMKVSLTANFEVLISILREQAPNAAFDARLLQVRVSPTVVSSGAMHLMSSSAATIDILAHVVAMSLTRTARPYR